MDSYLEAYGASEENRAKRLALLKRVVISVVLLLMTAMVTYAVFRNYPEEHQVNSFLSDLRNKDYTAAYRMWGCTEATPCRDYSFARFNEDWGPSSQHANAAAARLGTSQSCGSGVILRLDYPGAEPMNLWVERNNHVIGFAPWPECPGRHLHIGAFFRSLFNR